MFIYNVFERLDESIQEAQARADRAEQMRQAAVAANADRCTVRTLLFTGADARLEVARLTYLKDTTPIRLAFATDVRGGAC